MKEEKKEHMRTWLFAVSLGIVLIIVYKAIDSIGSIGTFLKTFMSVISPILIGLLMAYLIYIPESKIEKLFKKSKYRFIRKNARKFGILTTYVILILAILIIINFILPVLIESINELIVTLQNYYSKIITAYNNLPQDSIFKTEQVGKVLKELQNFDIRQYLSLEKITGYVKSVMGFATGIFDIFVAIVVSVYILAERTEIVSFFKKLGKAIFSKNIYQKINEYFDKANVVFFKFISSQFLDAIVVGLLTSIAMRIIGVKYAYLLGFMIGLFNMIPYFGAIVAVTIAAIITLITSGLSKTLIMLIVVIILQQIDANVINPKIIGNSLKISPIIVILSVTIGGAYFGIIGMLLAVPVAAVLKIMVNDYIDSKNVL